MAPFSPHTFYYVPSTKGFQKLLGSILQRMFKTKNQSILWLSLLNLMLLLSWGSGKLNTGVLDFNLTKKFLFRHIIKTTKITAANLMSTYFVISTIQFLLFNPNNMVLLLFSTYR